MSIALRALASLVAVLAVGSAWGQASPSVGDVLKLLRTGGYVIVFRHGATFSDQAETDPLHLDNVVKQRQLILDAFGKDWFEIFKPEGKGFALVARIQIAQWTTAAR